MIKYYKSSRYRIAGNFQGSKLSQICPKIILTDLIFADFIIQPFCTIIILQILFSQIAKRAKVIGLKSFWLYSIRQSDIILAIKWYTVFDLAKKSGCKRWGMI